MSDPPIRTSVHGTETIRSHFCGSICFHLWLNSLIVCAVGVAVTSLMVPSSKAIWQESKRHLLVAQSACRIHCSCSLGWNETCRERRQHKPKSASNEGERVQRWNSIDQALQKHRKCRGRGRPKQQSQGQQGRYSVSKSSRSLRAAWLPRLEFSRQTDRLVLLIYRPSRQCASREKRRCLPERRERVSSYS